MNWLYTLPNCDRCEIGRKVLADQQVEYREVRVEDPLTGEAIARIFGARPPMAPILLKDNAYHVLGQMGNDYRFVKILQRSVS